MRRVILAPAVLVTLAACTTGTSDYKDQTEDFLNDSGDVESLFDGADVSDASCEEPADTEVGTRYACTAEVEGVGSVDFDGLIDGEDRFSVIPSE